MNRRFSVLLLLGAAACAPEGTASSSDEPDGGAKEDRGDERAADILSMALTVDVSSRHAKAVLEVRPDGKGRLELDVHGLDVTTVSVPHRLQDGRLLFEDLPSAGTVLTIRYQLDLQDASDGLLASGVTLIWPYHCGNLFPCRSNPDDGLTFSVELLGVPEGELAIVPPRIEIDAPAYMLAWAVGPYTHHPLGETEAGTRVSVYYLPRGKTAALEGTRHLVGVFDWLERTLGPYAYGDEVASVSASWGGGAFGGMEHHPFWHVAEGAMDDAETHAHEAAHGWFGDGVRIRCWEDFVLSEGTVSYLAARALGQVAGPDVEKEIWADYRRRLDAAGDGVAWPDTACNEIDILEDGLFSDVPYMKGAFFFRDVADEIGAELLDEVLAAFYQARRGEAARMTELLEAIEARTGFDPLPLAEEWLR